MSRAAARALDARAARSGGQCCSGSCRPSGDSCLTPDECCSRVCSASADGGFACSAQCLGVGQACSSSADCCSGTCSLEDVCVAPPPPDAGTDAGTCKPIAASCTAGAECCTGKCNATTLVCEIVLT